MSHRPHLAVVALFFLQVGLAAGAGPLKVFILAGQSNMQGHAGISTFDYIGEDPKTAPMLKEMRGPDGKPRVSDEVWISLLNGARGGDVEKSGKLTAGFGARDECIGPEFTFGLYINKLLGEPVLLIKTAWGGKSLHTDFRPPGAGPHEFTAEQVLQMKQRGKDVAAEREARKEATGFYYRAMLAHVEKVLADPKAVYPGYDPKQGCELAGFVWFQGWNDLVASSIYPGRDQPGGYDLYSDLMAQFIRDVRKDLKAPELPFVIGVLGVGGPADKSDPKAAKRIHFQQAMAEPAGRAEFEGTVAAVATDRCWDPLQSAADRKKWEIKGELKKMAKDGRKFARGEQQELFEKKLKEALSPEEMEAYKGISNQGYHYLGSAKILGCIGREFAEAMAPMVKGK